MSDFLTINNDDNRLTARAALEKAAAKVEKDREDEELAAASPTGDDPACKHCSKPFEPRTGSGGKPQRFCSSTCRKEFNAQRSQRGPTYGDETEPAAPDQPQEPTPHQRRAMFITADEDICARVKPETAAEAVDRAVAEGKVSLAPEPEPDFDWSPDSEDLVLPEQTATAVYVNAAKAVVIRQERSWDQEEDSFVFVRPEYAVKLCKQILKSAGFGDVEFAQRAGGGFVDLN